MTRLMMAAATALVLSSAAASAQTIYVAPGYVGTYVPPTYTYGYTYAVPAPSYVVTAPTTVLPTVSYAAPLYDYVPTYGVVTPAWGW